MSEIMLILAREWIIGVIVSISVVLIGYLIFSILLVRSCRRNGYDIGVLGMIPFLNIIVFIKNIFLKRKLSSNIVNDEEFEL